MSDLKTFELESIENIGNMFSDKEVRRLSQEWINITGRYKYVYNWRWLGLPIIQLPTDIVATQELIWQVKPTIIIETGVARGGSLIFNASQLALIDLCERGGLTLNDTERLCIGIDIEIRPHNREAITTHPLNKMIHLIEGSSTEESTVKKLKSIIKPTDKVLVILDSNHSHQHVLEELRLYAPLVTLGSFIVVHDTGIEYAPNSMFHDREWSVGNSPLTAVREFLKTNLNFSVDELVSRKILISSSPMGYLRKVSA